MEYIHYYYLYDGEIKDCEHPFCIIRGEDDEVVETVYYSSQRIRSGLPVRIIEEYKKISYYNTIEGYGTILEGYEMRVLHETNPNYMSFGLFD